MQGAGGFVLATVTLSPDGCDSSPPALPHGTSSRLLRPSRFTAAAREIHAGTLQMLPPTNLPANTWQRAFFRAGLRARWIGGTPWFELSPSDLVGSAFWGGSSLIVVGLCTVVHCRRLRH